MHHRVPFALTAVTLCACSWAQDQSAPAGSPAEGTTDQPKAACTFEGIKINPLSASGGPGGLLRARWACQATERGTFILAADAGLSTGLRRLDTLSATQRSLPRFDVGQKIQTEGGLTVGYQQNYGKLTVFVGVNAAGYSTDTALYGQDHRAGTALETKAFYDVTPRISLLARHSTPISGELPTITSIGGQATLWKLDNGSDIVLLLAQQKATGRAQISFSSVPVQTSAITHRFMVNTTAHFGLLTWDIPVKSIIKDAPYPNLKFVIGIGSGSLEAHAPDFPSGLHYKKRLVFPAVGLSGSFN